MLDDMTACWWYEQDGQQAGPVTAAAVARLVAEGRLGPAHRVWRDGMAGWEALSAVAELAPALAAARPPSPPPLGPSTQPGERRAPEPAPRFPQGPAHGAPGGTTPGWGSPPSAAAAPRLEEIPVTAVVLLSIVTFGIYGLVRFHGTGKAYEALAGRTSSF